jgi:hypothetical protein
MLARRGITANGDARAGWRDGQAIGDAMPTTETTEQADRAPRNYVELRRARGLLPPAPPPRPPRPPPPRWCVTKALQAQRARRRAMLAGEPLTATDPVVAARTARTSVCTRRVSSSDARTSGTRSLLSTREGSATARASPQRRIAELLEAGVQAEPVFRYADNVLQILLRRRDGEGWAFEDPCAKLARST